MLRLIRRYAAALAALSMGLLALAAPYLIPANPDSAVFRSGTLGLILLCACYAPVRRALARHDARSLVYGGAFALIFAVCLSLGSELSIYDGLLPGMGSLLRRLAVPVMAAPALGALASFLFTLSPKEDVDGRQPIPFPAFFLLFVLCYGAVLLALWPGIISFDFPHEIAQYTSGEYFAAHPVFHTLLLGGLYQLGEALFGSMNAGAALYSVVQLLLLAAMFAWSCVFVQRRVRRRSVVLALAAFFALMPVHGAMAVSTAKDPLFSGLCVVLCLLLWEIAEDPDAFLHSGLRIARFAGCCLGIALLRHNGVFAFLPACIALIAAARGRRGRAALVAVCALAVSMAVPRAHEAAVGAQSAPSSEMMSVPCQQLMRTAEYADVTEEEYAELNSWFSEVTFRYRPHCADPAKGGNFAFERYQEDPGAFWSMYLHYARKYPRAFVEAFLENCVGLWAPDDVSHAHSLGGEEGEYVYLTTVYTYTGYDIDATSRLPALQKLIYAFMHDSVQQKYLVLAQLFAPATYSFLLLLATLLLVKRGHGRLALTALPLWGIFLSLLFSAGIFVRYAYPIMSGAPVLLALALFRREDA